MTGDSDISHLLAHLRRFTADEDKYKADFAYLHCLTETIFENNPQTLRLPEHPLEPANGWRPFPKDRVTPMINEWRRRAA